jgi:hypothetical protein
MGLTLRQLLEARYELPEVVWQELLTRGYADAYELAADEQEREEAFDAALAYLKRKGIRLRPKSPEPTLLTLFSSHALSRAFTAIQWGELRGLLNAPLDALTKRGFKACRATELPRWTPSPMDAKGRLPRRCTL